MDKQRLLTNVRIDATTLCALRFASQDNLNRFREFCEEYQRSGFADGVGVYWLDLESEDLPASSAPSLSQEIVNILEDYRLERMAYAIRKGRGYTNDRLESAQRVPVLNGTVDSAIGFNSFSW